MITSMAKQRTTSPATEPTEPTERIRLIIDTDEITRQAVTLRALKLSAKRKRRISNSDLLNEILRTELADEIRELSKPD